VSPLRDEGLASRTEPIASVKLNRLLLWVKELPWVTSPP